MKHFISFMKLRSNIRELLNFQIPGSLRNSVLFTNEQKTGEYRYLESKTLVFLQIKEFITYTSRATLLQKIVL